MNEVVEVVSEVEFLKRRLREAMRANAELGLELDEALNENDVEFWTKEAANYRRFWVEATERAETAERERVDVLKLLAQTMREIYYMADMRTKCGTKIRNFILSKGPLP